ncbi:flavin reductase family protein [uncultured Jatrophihabitans sp.]|uniref:flavin reductase family protein n=1 Tax=uncultured Jatrophihabitans sp. TaxID=1610747 RepID=UPI0035CB5414
MGAVATPVAVVTCMDGERPHGTTVSAFTSLSLDPPMVVVSLDRNSDLLKLIRRTRRFGVNVLSSEQSEIASVFARKGTDKFADVAWDLDAELPRVRGCVGWLACDVARLVRGGDHTLALGDIVAAGHLDLPPLTYHQRRFGTHNSFEMLSADGG